MSTYDIERQSYKTEYVPTETPQGHWSSSPEWIRYQQAKADAQIQPQIGIAPFSGPAMRIERETPEMQAAYAAFQANYPPEEATPAPTQTLSARDAALQAAQLDLRRAVGRMRIFAHPIGIIDLVTRMVSE